VWVLAEVFDHSHAELASVLGKEPAADRRLPVARPEPRPSGRALERSQLLSEREVLEGQVMAREQGHEQGDERLDGGHGGQCHGFQVVIQPVDLWRFEVFGRDRRYWGGAPLRGR
jgi:hypothetical protein